LIIILEPFCHNFDFECQSDFLFYLSNRSISSKVYKNVIRLSGEDWPPQYAKHPYNGSYKSSVRAVISSLGIRKKLVGPVRVSNLEKEIEQSQLKLGFVEGPPWHISLCPDLQSIGQTTFDNKLLTRLVTENWNRCETAMRDQFEIADF